MSEPRECIRCHRIRTISSRELCNSCYSYEYQCGDLGKYPQGNAKKKKRYDNCVDCGEYSHIIGRDRCKKCHAKWHRSQPGWKEKHAERMREERKNKPEMYQAIEERRQNTETRKTWKGTYNRQYYEVNSGKLRQYQVEWRQNNPEQFSGYMREARQRRIEAEGFTTEEQWREIVKYYCPDMKCPKCGQKFVRDIINRKLTQDHVIPINQGGTHWPINMQPLCYACNCSKSDHSCDDFRPDKGEFARSLMIND